MSSPAAPRIATRAVQAEADPYHSHRSIRLHTDGFGKCVLYQTEAPQLPLSEVILGYGDAPGTTTLAVPYPLAPAITPSIPRRGTGRPEAPPLTDTILQLPDIPAVVERVAVHRRRVTMPPHMLAPLAGGGALLT